jgi:acylphosphatase
MGETGDPRFTDALRRLISEPDPSVRKRAFSALAQIKTANAQPVSAQKWHVAGRMISGDGLKGMRRVMLAVAGEDAREQLKPVPLQFLLSEGTQYITSYKITEKPLPDAMSVVFVIPRSREATGGAFFDGALQCLRWKRPSDLWSIVPYIETGDGEPPPPRDPEPAVFTGNPDSLAAALRDTPKRLDCTDLWTGVWCATKQDGGQSRGKRHVIVLSSAEEGRIAGHGLIANMQNGRIPVQVIASGPNEQLQEFCRRTHTSFRMSAEDEIPAMIGQAYLNLLARYEIAYQPVAPNAPVLKVRIQAPGGWGETLIASGHEPEAAV